MGAAHFPMTTVNDVPGQKLVSELTQALLETSSRNEATYTLRLSLLPEAEA